MKVKRQSFKVGDKVKVKKLRIHTHPFINGNAAMHNTEGTTSTISFINDMTGSITLATGYIYHPSSLKKVTEKRPPIKVGDKVKVYRKVKWDGWARDMDEVLDGRVLIVNTLYKHPDFNYVRLNGYPYAFPFSCIKRA